MRTFIAIEIPEDIRTKIASFQNKLKNSRAFISWVKPDNIHVTLKFLGEIKDDSLPGIELAVERIAGQCTSFPIAVLGQGGFPSLRRPRVLWVGIKEGGSLVQSMAKILEDEMQKIGFARENRDFNPHLTIGRVKSQAHIEQVTRLMESDQFNGGTFTAQEIVIMKSDLKSTGAVYTPLKKIRFRTNISPEASGEKSPINLLTKRGGEAG